MSKCDYCGAVHQSPCHKQVQFQILQLCNALEQQLLKPDEKDAAGINHHLRSAWGFRDAVNDYFNSIPA